MSRRGFALKAREKPLDYFVLRKTSEARFAELGAVPLKLSVVGVRNRWHSTKLFR